MQSLQSQSFTIRKKTYKLCPHGNKSKYYCKECKGHGYCEHSKLKYLCIDCRGAGLCKCGKRYYLCVPCNEEKNLVIVNRVRYIKCSNCKKPSDTPYRKNIDQIDFYLNNDILCKECIKSDNISKGKICFVCKEKDTFKNARCLDCFQIYSSYEKTITGVENIIDRDKKLLPDSLGENKRSSNEILEKDLRGVGINKVQKINRFVKRMNKLLDSIRMIKKEKYWIERNLKDLFFSFTRDNNFLYFLQLNISSKHLNQIEEIFDFFIKDKDFYIVLRIIWYTIHRNKVVMSEMIAKTRILHKIKVLFENEIIDNTIINTVNDIIQHFQYYGF